ncbi:MAG TPA: hypothetical protein VD769_10915 [Gaiellaceae bacterium]|nr:hypothetical protein [Gaiellaceae bacterium]
MLRLYWARNDGLGGHVFLGLEDLERLREEMAAQGMSGWLQLERLEPGTVVPPGAVDFALSQASPEPKAIADEKLWHDWLAFLAGAAENGGVAVR